MSDYIIDDSKFLISEDEEQRLLPNDFCLMQDIKLGEVLDSSSDWNICLSANDKFFILVAIESLYQKWADKGYTQDVEFISKNFNNKNFYFYVCKNNFKLERLTDFKIFNVRSGLALFSAFNHTRAIDENSNLRDAIYLQEASLLLPTFSLIGEVCDKSLYKNALLKKDQKEFLEPTVDVKDQLNFNFVKSNLKKHGFEIPNHELYLEPGLEFEDFYQLPKEKCIATGPLIIHEHFQLFDTNSDNYVLILDKLLADAQIAIGTLKLISLNSICIDGKRYYALALSKAYALEKLNDRVFGYNKSDVLDLILAINKTKSVVKECKFSNALFLQECEVIVPIDFENAQDEKAMLVDLLNNGPFALSRFLDEINSYLIQSL